MSSDTAIKVESLSKCYQIYDKPRDRLMQMLMRGRKQYFREFWALRDVSFELKRGETVGIIGRNGSGKSTLLQLICGTLNPTSGIIQTNGRIAALLELGSGFNPEFSGRENVYLSCALLGLSKEETDARFDDIAAFADIGSFIEQPVKAYSSGMFVRLAFAVNIVSQPDIMIVDEALAVGDMSFQAKCMTALTRIQDQGATVLFVSHDVGAVKSLCKQAVLLEHGQVIATGPAPVIAEQYIRTMREEMSAEARKFSRPPTEFSTKAEKANAAQIDSTTKASSAEEPGDKIANTEFKRSDEFDRRVAAFRYGVGGARIVFAELLDSADQPVVSAEFNQQVAIRVYLDAQEEADISVNYYIQDDKKNLILGAGLRTVEAPLLHCAPSSRHVVTYSTFLPLHEGNYSIHLELTRPAILDQSAEFLDVIDDAITFNIQRRINGRIWAKVYIENTVEVKDL